MSFSSYIFRIASNIILRNSCNIMMLRSLCWEIHCYKKILKYFLLLMDLISGWLCYRGCGGWCGEHRVWLCGLWRTEYDTYWSRPLLLQHGQTLAMTALELTVTHLVFGVVDEKRRKTFQKKERSKEAGEWTVMLLFNCIHFLFVSTWDTFDVLFSKYVRTRS